MQFRLLLISAIVAALNLQAEDASSPIGDPVLETPTLTCLGAYWLIHGDDNRNAKVEFSARMNGSDGAWKRGPDLFRIEKNDGTYGGLSGKTRPTVHALSHN